MTAPLEGITGAQLEREIGRVRGAAPGPTLIVVAGVHGNEHAGVAAAERVVGELSEDDLCGELLLLRGNVRALSLRRRYQVKDLNRIWTDEQLFALRRTAERDRDPEDREQLELLTAIEDAMARARGDVYLVDLHTTSAPGIPFALFGDTLRQRRFALAFPLPLLLGLEEQLDGVLSAFFSTRGCIAIAIEGGQHDDPASIDNLAACLRIALVASGVIDGQRSEAAECRARHAAALALLASRRGALPPVIEVIRRHAITPDDEFCMAPGFANLDHAARGRLLARDRRGEIRAKEDGIVILPLYQGLGSDGFFWGRAVSRARLALAEGVRRLRLDVLLPLLPGVRRDRMRPERLRADKRIARLYPLDVFHVFGYRRIREDGRELVVARHC